MISRSNISISQQQNDNFNKTTDQIANKDITSNSIEISSHGELSRMIQDFDKMNTNEIESITTTSKPTINQDILPENDLSIIVNEITKLIIEVKNKGTKLSKQCVLNYINNQNTNPQKIYDQLYNNQNNNSNSTFLLGYFNYCGIVTGNK